MNDLKAIFAGNLIALRTKAGMTQAELAEKIHYSDKSISKWERAESLPDLQVTKELADVFGVTVDYLITPHDAWEGKPVRIPYRTDVITAVSLLGIVLAALIVFVILHWTLDKLYWVVFLAAVPVMLITLLILNCVWGKAKYHPVVISLLLLGVFGLLFFILREYVHVRDLWFLALLWLPAQVIVFLSFHILHKK